jgi:NAD(P)-dependent dehydrogenase (short-subunit alcohol dehydrogenase family)
MANDHLVWLITGASSGIGRALAGQLSEAGEMVIGTFRRPEQASAFTGSGGGRSRGVVADVTDVKQVEAAVGLAAEVEGRIDVVVNAAGYAVVGAVEELSDAEMLDQLDVNLFGVHRVVRAVLPWLRAVGRGTIVNVGSVAGQVGYPGLGAYDASKAALELLSEALGGEVAPLGIRVIIVEPGNVRTEWAGRSMVFAGRRIGAYDDTAGASRSFFAQLHGHQPGDPEVVAAAIRDAVAEEDPPLRLVIGEDARQWISGKIQRQLIELGRWRPSSS